MLSSSAVGLNRFLVWVLLMGITSSNLEIEAVAFTEVSETKMTITFTTVIV